MTRTLGTCLKGIASAAGMLVLLGSMAVSACAIPVLLIALLWLG